MTKIRKAVSQIREEPPALVPPTCFRDKDLLIINIKEFTVNDERELIFAFVTLYKDLY